MKFPALATLIIVATTVGDGVERSAAPPELTGRMSRTNSVVAEPSYSPVQVGDRAPDFSWIGVDNRPHRLREVLEQANALLIFAPTDEVLQKLEAERDELAQISVVPVAVVDARGRSAVSRARRLGVHVLMVPDPAHVVGSQFSLLALQSAQLLPAWFAVDRRGIVRGLGNELDSDAGWTRIAASALAIPSPEVPLPARTR